MFSIPSSEGPNVRPGLASSLYVSDSLFVDTSGLKNATIHTWLIVFDGV